MEAAGGERRLIDIVEWKMDNVLGLVLFFYTIISNVIPRIGTYNPVAAKFNIQAIQTFFSLYLINRMFMTIVPINPIQKATCDAIFSPIASPAPGSFETRQWNM